VPESSAEGWCKNAVEFVLSVASDPRYAGKTIVHMGDSAGGWMSLRIKQLLCGLALGEEAVYGLELDEGALSQVKQLAGRGAAVLFSPVVNVELNQALRDKEPFVSAPRRYTGCRG
jgi:hypothetical protein